MMTLPFGINLRVTANSNQGGRKYMEDTFAVAYQKTPDEKDLEFAYFGIFDGHGGREAAVYAQDHLLDNIADQKGFWSEDDNHVLKAIKDGFMITHRAMWKELGKWPKTVTGLPSTSGTTASIIFIRRGKLFIGHVGDSGIVLGLREPGSEHFTAMPLTKDHKPESPAERKRIEKLGGSVVSKSGVQRVVWNRPRLGHKGPVRRSTRIDQIPFLAVARSLGDLWSYNFYHGEFVVSPEPDVKVVDVDLKRFRCLILASDGLWNMLSPHDAVRLVEEVERREEQQIWEEAENNENKTHKTLNPSKILVKRALSMWNYQKMRADNTTVVTVMIDPQGPSRCEVLIRHRTMKRLRSRGSTDTSMYFLTDPNSIPSPQTISHSETSELNHSHKATCKRSDTLKRKLSTFDSSTPSFESPPNESSWKRKCCDSSSVDPITRSPYNDGAVKLESSSEWQTNNNNNPFCNNNNTFTFNHDLHVLSYPGSGIGKTLPPTPKISDCSNAEFGKVSCPRKILDDMCTNIGMYSGINASIEDGGSTEKLENSCESCLDRQDCENNHLGNLEDSQNNNNGLKSFKLASNSRLNEDLCVIQNKCCVCDIMVAVHSGQKKPLPSNPLQHENNCTSKLPSEDTRVPNSKECTEAENTLRNGRIPFSTDLKSLSKHQRRLNLLLKRKPVVKEIPHSLGEQQQNKCIESKNSTSSHCKAENNYSSDGNINLKHSKILKQSKLQTLSHIRNDKRRKPCYERSCNLRKKGHA